MSAVGILGGTFDPVHRGHLALASGAAAALGLDSVLLLPCAVPPHKPDPGISAAYHRLEMLYLATEGRDHLGVSPFEMAAGGVRFTIDTLRALRARGEAPIFVIGSDALAEIPTWHDHSALLAEFDFAVVLRPREPGSPQPVPWPEEVRRRIVEPEAFEGARTCGDGGRILRIVLDPPAVSSSLVREQAAAALPIDSLVPSRVARYIQRYRLYR